MVYEWKEAAQIKADAQKSRRNVRNFGEDCRDYSKEFS